MKKLKLVFLIDDNHITQFISSKTIEKSDAVEKVKCFASAEEVLLDLSKNGNNKNELPDLILLDVMMPSMDGWQFLERYKLLAPEIKQNIKVCLFTSSLNLKQRESVKSNSLIFDYIVKPLTHKKLNSLIMKMQN